MYIIYFIALGVSLILPSISQAQSGVYFPMMASTTIVSMDNIDRDILNVLMSTSSITLSKLSVDKEKYNARLRGRPDRCCRPP
jgi:hypothetical protein